MCSANATLDQLTPRAPEMHHVAIQTSDVAGTIHWYETYLGAESKWTLGSFSETTTNRLPGITCLTELKVGNLRVHVFDRGQLELSPPAPDNHQFQHLGLTVEHPEQLHYLRERWFQVRDAGTYQWQRYGEPSPIATDPDGAASLYVLDPNGLEIEFVFLPQGRE